MNTISKKIMGWFVVALCTLAFSGCDFHGPWEFYPEETEIYGGIYTYGYIIEGSSPRVCFEKIYQLEEAAAENFAFYDSAYVTVEGMFNDGASTLRLLPGSTDPNCFGVLRVASIAGMQSMPDTRQGLAGETYTMHAYFKWDSAGTTVESRFRAKATIPVNFGTKGISIPLQNGKYKWRDYKAKPIGEGSEVVDVDFLEYPMDMSVFKIALDYNESVGGVIAVMLYDNEKGGESMNTTINHMLGGMLSSDSTGYTGISMHDPLEHMVYEGYETNEVIAGIRNLDSVMMTNMSFPIGDVRLRIYATDKAYADYRNKVMAALEDPRVVPESNIEGGMGVFSGMTGVEVRLKVHADDFVTFEHISQKECIIDGTGQDQKPWGSKACRLNREKLCMPSYYYVISDEACYSTEIVAGLREEGYVWYTYLPTKYDAKAATAAFAEGLMLYCIESDFENNDEADCNSLYKQCQESLERTSCKETEWEWCADRDWNLEEYPQCGTALVSRYYLEEQKSSILKKVVENWCKANPKDKQCSRE